jgi:threonine dehydrogenase-like Zn-dependent dehydrogenase
MEEFPIPQPGERQVLLRTERTLVSAGTELTSLRGELATHSGFPLYPGYSNVGVVEAVGPGVEQPKPGQRLLTMGGHASHILLDLSPEKGEYWQPLPDSLPSEQAVFGILGSVAMHGVRRAHPALGESAAIFGQGVVGQLILQLARLNGCRPVIALDLFEERLRRSEESGADYTVNVSSEDPVSAIARITADRGADLLFEATRNPQTIPVMLGAAARGGRLLIVGSLPGEVSIDAFTQLQLRELSIIGVFQPAAPLFGHHYFPWTQRRNRQLFLELVNTGQVKVEHLITHRLPATSAAKAYSMIHKGRAGWLGIIFEWD